MNIDDGNLRKLNNNVNSIEMLSTLLFPREVLVNEPSPQCKRCQGKGSIKAFIEASRAERRNAWRLGVPKSATYIPCPECNGYSR